ncbi:MAG: phage head closure protein [Alistipes sp.]|jgi:SPP1 family predicted phage head-tail adaptor|nr:phage head closure protein [Alistipes sp.]
MINAGQLTTKIEIIDATDGRNAYGEQTREWDKVFCETRCGILKRSGRRALIAGEVTESSSREIIIRWRNGIHIRQRVRFVDDDEVFAIQNIEPSRRDGSIILRLAYISD